MEAVDGDAAGIEAGEGAAAAAAAELIGRIGAENAERDWIDTTLDEGESTRSVTAAVLVTDCADTSISAVVCLCDRR